MNRVVVVGSINVDSILHIAQLPQPGETISMQDFSKAPGGKGANQAVAAARNGAQTSFIGRVGEDENGQLMLRELGGNNIETRYVQETVATQTGQAYILLQASGQNSIIIQHGANYALNADDVHAAHDLISRADFVVAECETPVEATIAAFEIAHAAGKQTILNPAPAQVSLPEALLRLTDFIIPNETEAEMITGITVTDLASMRTTATQLHQLGIAGVIITLGERGSYVSLGNIDELVPAFAVKAVDTTAAGDTFIGALASELQPDANNLPAAVRYASMASAFTVQTMGALPSIPRRDVVVATLEKINRQA
ncbi:ribokinase [Lacticaseibacillus saniviri]